MRIIIIDDSREHLATVRRLFAEIYPEVEVTEVDPEQRGLPGPSFGWSFYDLLVIRDRLAAQESGLLWLKAFKSNPDFPPAILLADAADPLVAQQAGTLPNVAYALSEELDSALLARLVGSLKVEERTRRVIDPRQQARLDQDRDIVEKVFLGGATQGRGTLGGTRDSGYRFVRMIGQGAHSRVYLAERLEDRQTLVLKVMDIEDIHDDTIVKRFAREAELLAAIDSPYVVKFFDHGFTPTYGYIAVEFFTRGDLKQRLEHGIDTETALVYVLNIAFGLEAIHMQNIVHRDLKPGNIMFRADDSLALADFGISKHLDSEWDLTKTGSILGTLNYLSPEQGLGNPVDQRTDLYGLGMILFELLTGEKAFRAGSPSALVYQHLYADVPRLPAPYEDYQPLIDKLLAKDPADRYQSASELVANLQPLCD